METLAKAISVDDFVKVKEIVSSVISTGNFCDGDSDEVLTLSSEDFQDTFVQAAFCGSLKSLQFLADYGKNGY